MGDIDEAEKLWLQMAATSKRLMLSPYKSGQGNENQYAAVYRELVRSGLAMKLKKKYNG